MLFNEIYSVYYNAVAKILETAFKNSITDRDIQRYASQQAFSDSALTIIPALKSGKWPLFKEDLTPVLEHEPSMPLTALEKRWLKSIFSDPRIKLFGVKLPELENTEPLFTEEDYRIYDKYSDGDPFEDESYIKNFRTILSAVRNKTAVKITMVNRHGEEKSFRFYPKEFEYSVKDDKIRVIAADGVYRQFNLARITECEPLNDSFYFEEAIPSEQKEDLTLLITDRRNALERVMLHFAHFEKQAEKLDNERYILKLKYAKDDETEIVIRVLSFGPHVKVIEPQSFVELIKERLSSQKICGLS